MRRTLQFDQYRYIFEFVYVSRVQMLLNIDEKYRNDLGANEDVFGRTESIPTPMCAM